MKKTGLICFLICLCSMEVLPSPARSLSEEYRNFRRKAVQIDKNSRKILATLYTMTKRLKHLSKKRNRLNNRIIDV
ncbi:MAG: hypothetical protein D6797_07925, partial [Bdellovibrio sp.]